MPTELYPFAPSAETLCSARVSGLHDWAMCSHCASWCNDSMSRLLNRVQVTDRITIEVWDHGTVEYADNSPKIKPAPISEEQAEEELRLLCEQLQRPIGPRLKNNHFFSHRKMC